MDTLPTTPDAGKPQPTPEATAGVAKQYIRTFHGDVETIKRGGTPDLAPLNAPPVSLPVPQPTTQSAPPPLILALAHIPAPAPAPKLMPLAGTGSFTTADTNIFKTTPLKTYAGDFTDRMKETKASTVTVLAAEQDQEPILIQSQPKKSSLTNSIYIAAGVVLVVAGGVGAYLAYTQYISDAVPVMLAPYAKAPIFVDDSQEVSGTGASLMQAIQQSAVRPLAQGSIRLLYQGTETTGTSVFSTLQLPAPGALLRNINNEQSMAGIAEVSGVENPFFILSVTSFGDTFAAMLQWEPRMPRDLFKLFPAYPAQASARVATSTIATTTSATPPPATTTPPALITPLSTAGFFDVTVSNHDVRVYRDAAGRDVLLYGYWNRTTLVIARDAAAFTEIIGRLATSRTP